MAKEARKSNVGQQPKVTPAKASVLKVDWALLGSAIIKLGNIVITYLLTKRPKKGTATYIIYVVDRSKVDTVVPPMGDATIPASECQRILFMRGIGENFRRTLHTLKRLKPDI